jgi:hypothetical protein
LANVHHFQINLVRDTTISLQEFAVMEMDSGADLTKTHIS